MYLNLIIDNNLHLHYKYVLSQAPSYNNVYFRVRVVVETSLLTMDFAMDGQFVSSDVVLPFPSLREACVKRIVQDTAKIVEGIEFNELASPKYSYILGPFSHLGMHVSFPI